MNDKGPGRRRRNAWSFPDRSVLFDFNQEVDVRNVGSNWKYCFGSILQIDSKRMMTTTSEMTRTPLRALAVHAFSAFCRSLILLAFQKSSYMKMKFSVKGHLGAEQL